MYIYALLTIVLFTALDYHSITGAYKHSHPIYRRSLSHVNDTMVQDEQLAQKPDRCGPVALRCYEPILSYIDGDGEFCGWKQMSTFMALPTVCGNIKRFTLMKWGDDIMQNNYKFLKICHKIIRFQQCVYSNEVCTTDKELFFLVSMLTNFCKNIQTILSVMTCRNAWHRNDNWWKLVYTYDVIVQACPRTHYRQLSLNSIKLFLFSYITYPSSWINEMSLNAEAAGRSICQYMQQRLCLMKRGDELCGGYLALTASQNYNDNRLINACRLQAANDGKCNAFVKMKCPIDLTTGHMLVKVDFQDITNIYNLTYWRALGNSEADMMLHTVNEGVSHCDASNLIFKQIGCFHKYMAQLDMNHANQGDYLTKYMCSNIKIYNSCFEAYINLSCPYEAQQFQGIGNLLHIQCDIFRVAMKNVTCPLFGVYSSIMVEDETLFSQIMYLMRQYITVINYKQMNSVPLGWRDGIIQNADVFISYYKSVLIKGEKLSSAADYANDIISTVCEQEAADVYNDYATLTTGEQYYQLVNHVIKGYGYIKYLVQNNG